VSASGPTGSTVRIGSFKEDQSPEFMSWMTRLSHRAEEVTAIITQRGSADQEIQRSQI
jgi:hypothetical protein